MRLRHIEVFHAIYTTGSITSAAEMLHVSQPSVSKVLHHAELQLGFELFNRVKGKLTPTAEAVALIDEVNKVYHQINSLKKSARNLKENLRGHISIAVMPALSLNLLPEAISRFHRAYPDITFDVQTRHHDQVPDSLFEYENDIGLVFNPQNLSGLGEVDIGSAELVCVHPSDVFADKAERLSIDDIRGHKFITISDSGPLGDILEEAFRQADFQASANIRVQTYYIAKNLVGYGSGVAIVDEFTARAEGPGDVRFSGFNPPLDFSIKGLFLENRPLSKVCESFLGVVKEVYADQQALAQSKVSP